MTSEEPTLSAASSLRETARSFVSQSFAVLRSEDVLPTSAYRRFLRVGTDYFGDSIHGVAAYALLETQLAAVYPDRFAETRPRPNPEFPSTYIFSLLEAAIARCALDGDYSDGAIGIEDSVAEMVSILDAAAYEVVCCRAVSHLTTETGEPVEVGPVSVVPESSGFRSGLSAIADVIPAAPSVFDHDRLFVYDPPHALLVARASSDAADPYSVARALSQSLERFLLNLRLLTAGTVQSDYEITGTTTLVTRMAPVLTSFHRSGTRIRRTARVDGSEADELAAIDDLIQHADIKRQGMVFTSFDVALRKFHGSYGIGGPLEHLVDLATALEATLASGDKDNAGLTLRLRNRAAALLATTNDPGPTIFADVGRLYGLRSTLVHGGQSKEAAFWRTIEQVSTVPAQESRARLRGVDLDRAVDRMRDLVRRAILARVCLAGGSDPLWPFSGEVTVDALLTDDAVREKWRTYWQTQLREIGAGDAIGPPRIAADFLSPDE